MKDLILIGKQGAGKGVEGELLAEKYGFKIFETGAALRELSKSGSDLGNKIKDIINNGDLVSDELIMEIVDDFINKIPENTPVIFDGIPRSENQRKLLEIELEKVGRDFNVLEIELDDKIAIDRLLKRVRCAKCNTNFGGDVCPNCGSTDLIKRDDDKDKNIILKRLENFRLHTLPAIEKWRNTNKIITINGDTTIEKCFSEICSKIN